MREAFNNNSNQVKPKATKQQQQQFTQLSQRSTQSHHQKTNSMSSKIGPSHHHNIMSFEEQQHQVQATINSQLSAANNQFQQQKSKNSFLILLIDSQKVNQASMLHQTTVTSQNAQPLNQNMIQTGLIAGVSHKKSNSLMNSKMAQILLKNAPSSGQHQNNPLNLHQQQLIIASTNKGGSMLHGNVIAQHQKMQSNNQSLFHQQQQYFLQAQLMAAQQQQMQLSNNSNQDYKNLNQNLSQNLTSSLIGGPLISHQTSFTNNQNDMGSMSIDYQKQPFIYEDYEGQTNLSSKMFQQNQIMHMNPSQKQILSNIKSINKQHQPINIDVYIQQNIQTLQETKQAQVLKKQNTHQVAKNQDVQSFAISQQAKGISAQKQFKKSITTTQAPNHQRTKSDTYYNRGSITIKQQPQQLSKRVSNGAPTTSNTKTIMEAHDQVNSRQIVNPQHQSKASNGYILQNTGESHTVAGTMPRRAPNSAQHSKKPSQTNAQHLTVAPTNLISQQSQNKKSTKDKYNELKAMYDDLLERHFAQQKEFQQNPTKVIQQQPNMNYNAETSHKPNGANLVINHNLPLTFDNQVQSNTPRIGMTGQQMSKSILNQNSYINSKVGVQNNLETKNIMQLPAKSIKQVNKNEQDKIQPKTALKMNLVQGQSRKNAQGNHKRSASDGNEQLFKFKQQAMQRYLYPQPSNQTLQTINSGGTIIPNYLDQLMAPLNSEETLTSGRSKPAIIQQSNFIQSITPYQQPSHQRRVSDDHMQKQKKSQLFLENNQPQLKQNPNHSKNNAQIENIADIPAENQKLNTIDFNIKGFLLEMRNKHNQPISFNEKSGMANQQEVDFINIVDEQQQFSYNPPSPNPSNHNHEQYMQQIPAKNQFDMIIEENSPINQKEFHHDFYQNAAALQLLKCQEIARQGVKGTLDSQRKIKVGESQLSQISKQDIEFNNKMKKYKQMKLDDKRSSSPNIELDKKHLVTAQKNHLVQVSHKRVKSDIPEIPKKHGQMQPSFILSKNPKGIPPNNLKSKGPQQQSLMHSNLSNMGSGVNLFSNSDKTTPKKFQQKQKLPLMHFAIGADQLYQQQKHLSSQLEGSGSKKVINVSIDLIQDGMNAGMLSDEEIIGDINSYLNDSNQDEVHTNMAENGGHWVIVDNSKPKDLNLQEVLEKNQKIQSQQQPTKGVKKPVLKGQIAFSGGNDPLQRHDKYKKMISKYDNRIESVINMNSGSKSSRKQTFDIGFSVNNSSNISPTALASQQSPKNRFSINDKMNDIYKKQKSTKLIIPSSPKQLMGQHFSQQKNPVKVQNLMQPQKQHLEKQLINTKQSKTSNAAPNNSVVQTQESPISSIVIQPNIVVPWNIGERIDTQDSTASDPNLSPRTRGVNKLLKHIKLSFKQTSQPPNTTVDFYRIGKVLGKGAFGKVNLALHKLSGKFAAVKSINKQYLSEEAQTKKVMQEVVILKRTRHRNIVRLYEFFETQKHILFVIELCAGGDLLNYVRRRRRLKEDAAKSIFKQIIEGLSYCHSKSILHRDIKLDNILLDSEGEVKICDFGVSKIVKKGEIMSEQCGTPAYIAPEILRDKGYEGFAVDIWSAGVVLYAMLYGTVPFKANNMSELQKLIIKAKYTLKDDITEEAQSLLTGLLEKDPAKRLTVEQILSHKWLEDASDQVQLFTQQEKDYIKNEFTYNDTDRFNRNETDPFTEHMLDSTNNSMLKNQTSKSVILAPFNSTKSNLCPDDPALTESMRALLQSKSCLKFAPRVRDVDKQYEINNNADLDNGVYHKFDEEEEKVNAANEEQKKLKENEEGEDSLQSSFNKESSMKSDDDEESLRLKKQKQKKVKSKEKQTELQKLESLIYQQEDNIDNPYLEIYGDNILIRDEQPQNTQNQDERKSLMPKSNIDHAAKGNGSDMNVLQTAQTLIIDDQVIAQIEMMGYPRDYIVKCLNNNELNYASAGYYLLQSQNCLSFGDPFQLIK